MNTKSKRSRSAITAPERGEASTQIGVRTRHKNSITPSELQRVTQRVTVDARSYYAALDRHARVIKPARSAVHQTAKSNQT